MTISVRITQNVSQGVADLLRVNTQKGFAIIGNAAADKMREHFVKREGRKHPKGWPKTHFFDRARLQTHASFTGSSATVAVSLEGFATHFLGKPETIRPKASKYLTIPATGQAYGRRAREFNDLVFAVVPNEQGHPQPALVQARQTTFAFGKPKKDGTRSILRRREVGGNVYFWLAKVVKPKPHPDAMPTEKELLAAIKAELDAYVASI